MEKPERKQTNNKFNFIHSFIHSFINRRLSFIYYIIIISRLFKSAFVNFDDNIDNYLC